MVLGVLSLLQATLTLPGIAGIILTIGMAVDANVLIFERIKEELRNGSSMINSVDNGYKRALSTIMDANITTLIAAIILFFMASGPVRGFSITLAIGIFTSVFTAFTVTRYFISLNIRKLKANNLGLKL
jgi:protein-export membrane protein SecD